MAAAFLAAACLLGTQVAAVVLQDASEDQALEEDSGWLKDATETEDESVCHREYYRVMRELREKPGGVDYIIGAYDGETFDPAQASPLNWYSSTPHRKKIMVEAVKPLFKKLQDNAHKFENVTLRNEVVGKRGEELTLYCYNSTGPPLANEPELRGEMDYWNATCQSTKHNLINNLHVFGKPWFQDFHRTQKLMIGWGKEYIAPEKAKEMNFDYDGQEWWRSYSEKYERVKELEALVDEHISTHTRLARPIADFVDEYGRKDVGYVQVDIEDKTDSAVLDLILNEFGKDGFMPKVMLFEFTHFADKGFDRLQELGYDICTFNHFGGNVLAYRPEAGERHLKRNKDIPRRAPKPLPKRR